LASNLAFPLLILGITHSALLAGLAAALGRVPYLFLGLLAGVLLDRWDRKWSMIACDAGRALALAAIPLADLTRYLSVALIYAVILAEGIGFTVYDIAEQAILPRLVAKEQLAAATGFGNAGYSIAALLGPSIGGFLYQLGRTLPFVVDVVSYVASVFGLLLTRARFQEEPRPATGGNLSAEIKEGLKWLWHQPLVRFMALLTAGVNLLVSGMPLVIIVLMRQELHGSPAGTGVVLGLMAVGNAAGGLIAVKVQVRLTLARAIIADLWLVALAWLLLALAGSVVMVAATGTLVSLLLPIYEIVQYSYRAIQIPDRLQGRVTSAFHFVGNVGFPVGLAMSGALLQSLGPRLTIVVLGLIVVVLATVASASPVVRNALPLR
jgi:MFS family permease